MTHKTPQKLPPSPYPRYDAPLRVTDSGRGVLCIFDLHAPYHNADFVNKVLDLAAAWGVDQLVLGGDFTDQHAVSRFGAEFKAKDKISGDYILDVMRSSDLSDAERGKFLNIMTQAGFIGVDDGLSGELAVTRQVLRTLGGQFRQVFAVMGNHDDRLLRRIDKDLTARDLLNFLLGGSLSHWQIEPFYFAEVFSGGEKFLVEHQHGTARGGAAAMAAKFSAHVICGHNHIFSIDRDISGRYWAINAGHCGDELRMNYAVTRHNTRPAHQPGAVIIRDGYPWHVGEWTQFEKLKRCK